ncbi:MAG: nucleoside-diphosphate sugar epimerase/dehydratase [Fimbriimonadales bacterium]
MQKEQRRSRLASIPPWRWAEFVRSVITDILLVSLALMLSIGFAKDFAFDRADRFFLEAGAPALSFLAVVLLFWQGLYRIHSRYAGLSDLFRLFGVSLLLSGAGLVAFGLASYWAGRAFTSAEPVLFAFIATTFLTLSRIGRRMMDWYRAVRYNGMTKRRTLVVGGGDAGEMVMRETQRNPQSEYQVVGFVDDNPAKRHMRIHGYPWMGTTEDIPRLVAEHGIQEVVIAIPSAKGETIRRIFQICKQTSARVRIVPPIPAVFEQGVHLTHIREIHIEDLLQREPTQFDLRSLSDYIQGERVMITGAGGSIGSELARQVAQLGPASLILVGKGENSIYQVEQELKHAYDYEPRCVIGDVRDRTRMRQVFAQEKPTLVLHAAAHKHVPLMEANPIEAIKNNVLGTWVIAECCVEFNVVKMVYVSTDKAVKPVSIMGATKRVGEMIVSALAQESSTEFAIVRFGNVLGSRGSLVPTLQQQIQQGGPVRLTHAEMKRYFMSIGEAVHLILRAGAYPSHGDIYILDMGEPVRIIDLAHDLIRLYGLVPDKDIKIVFTGIRPGEKLHEELCYDEEMLEPTSTPKVRRVRNHQAPDWDWLQTQLCALMDYCNREQAEQARTLLLELATGRLSANIARREGISTQ